MGVDKDISKYFEDPAILHANYRNGQTKYTPAIAEKIFEGMANGKTGARTAKELGLSFSVVWQWINNKAGFKERYFEAKEICAEYYADMVIEISEEAPRTFINKDGAEVVDPGDVQNRKLRLESLKWAAGVLKPKRFGAKLDVSGEVTVNHKLSDRLDKALSMIDVTPMVKQISYDSAAASASDNEYIDSTESEQSEQTERAKASDNQHVIHIQSSLDNQQNIGVGVGGTPANGEPIDFL